FLEIERCLRSGVAFDLLWDLPGLQPSGYREVVRVREDEKVEVAEKGKARVFGKARVPSRPEGAPPQLKINLSRQEGSAPLPITARARVVETSAPVFYTFGTDKDGVYRNAAVAWEIYGLSEEDYRFLQPPGLTPNVV